MYYCIYVCTGGWRVCYCSRGPGPSWFSVFSFFIFSVDGVGRGGACNFAFCYCLRLVFVAFLREMVAGFFCSSGWASVPVYLSLPAGVNGFSQPFTIQIYGKKNIFIWPISRLSYFRILSQLIQSLTIMVAAPLSETGARTKRVSRSCYWTNHRFYSVIDDRRWPRVRNGYVFGSNRLWLLWR